MAGEESTSDASFQYRRAPARPRRIAEIDPEKDIRVRITGRVVGKADGMLTLEDDTGRADIVFDDVPVPESGAVRVFCRVLPLESGYELRAELVQDASRMDAELYRKVMGNGQL